METIIKKTEFYTVRPHKDGFVAELDSSTLYCFPGLPNIKFHDTDMLRLAVRVTKAIAKALSSGNMPSPIHATTI